MLESGIKQLNIMSGPGTEKKNVAITTRMIQIGMRRMRTMTYTREAATATKLDSNSRRRKQEYDDIWDDSNDNMAVYCEADIGEAHTHYGGKGKDKGKGRGRGKGKGRGQGRGFRRRFPKG